MKIAEFDVGTGRGQGEVVRENEQTTIIKLRRGGNTKEIKRHNEKHNVVIIDES